MNQVKFFAKIIDDISSDGSALFSISNKLLFKIWTKLDNTTTMATIYGPTNNPTMENENKIHIEVKLYNEIFEISNKKLYYKKQKIWKKNIIHQ